MKNDRKIPQFLWIILAALCCWAFFFFVYPYHLFTKEQTSLFSTAPSFLRTFFDKPAFFSEIAGGWLTQFFFYRGGGPTVITLLLVILYIGIWLSFKKIGVSRSMIWAAVPCVIEAALSCNIEYPLSMTFGSVVAVWFFLLCSLIGNKVAGMAVDFLLAILLYPAIGVSSFLFGILSSLKYFSRKQFVAFALCIVLCALAPLAWSGLFLMPPAQAYCYPIVTGYMYRNVYMFLAMPGSVCLAFIISCFTSHIAFPSVAAVLSLAACLWLSADFDNEYLYGISSEAYFGNWDKVIAMSARNEKIHRYVPAYYANLAYAKRGTLPDSLLFRYQPGYHAFFIPVSSSSGYLNDMISIDALVECRDLAQAQHSAIVAMNSTPHQRSSRVAREMVEMSFKTGSYDLAEKMSRILEGSFPHRKWAREALDILKEGKPAPLAEPSDTLFTFNSWPDALRTLVASDPYNHSALDYLLCFDLLNKDVDSFKADYDSMYLPVWGKGVPPELYQEALVMILSREEDPIPLFSKYHISKAVYDRCVDYSTIFAKNQGKMEAIPESFRKSYWFYLNYAQIK
jgi:hypothetical protein